MSRTSQATTWRRSFQWPLLVHRKSSGCPPVLRSSCCHAFRKACCRPWEAGKINRGFYHLKPKTVEKSMETFHLIRWKNLASRDYFQKAQPGLPSQESAGHRFTFQAVGSNFWQYFYPIFSTYVMQCHASICILGHPGWRLPSVSLQVEIWVILEWRARCQSSRKMRKLKNLHHALWRKRKKSKGFPGVMKRPARYF